MRKLAVIAVLASSLLGCGSNDGSTTVEGAVTYQGKAVTYGIINFVAAGGKPIGGPLKPDGTYSYELPPGEYQVRIDAPGVMPPWKEGEPMPKEPPRLAPEKYASYTTSELTATITGESPQQLDFALP